MQHECIITVLDKKCFTEYQEQYLADTQSGPCLFFNVGDTVKAAREELKRKKEQEESHRRVKKCFYLSGL